MYYRRDNEQGWQTGKSWEVASLSNSCSYDGGTAMAIENGYYSAETSFEIGNLAQQTLVGNLEAKEKFRSFFWAAHQLARKMNLMQMAEATKSCPDLKSVFDLSAMVRMRNRRFPFLLAKSNKKDEKSIFYR